LPASSTLAPGITLPSAQMLFDAPYHDKGLTLLGVDEVGRGSWVGPIVAAAVHLPKALRADNPAWLHQLNDSKQLTADNRQRLAALVTTHAQVAVAQIDVEAIEAMNVHHASLHVLAMAANDLCKALAEATTYSAGNKNKKTNNWVLSDWYCLVDGCHPLPAWANPQQAVIKGDGLSASIAAASLVAKVYRDALLTDWHAQYPHYEWANNKGYGTKKHQQAVLTYGPCPLHRPRFLRKLLG
jgi:ribonuclease HII